MINNHPKSESCDEYCTRLFGNSLTKHFKECYEGCSSLGICINCIYQAVVCNKYLWLLGIMLCTPIVCYIVACIILINVFGVNESNVLIFTCIFVPMCVCGICLAACGGSSGTRKYLIIEV